VPSGDGAQEAVLELLRTPGFDKLGSSARKFRFDCGYDGIRIKDDEIVERDRLEVRLGPGEALGFDRSAARDK
jgi:hypothetical protein